MNAPTTGSTGAAALKRYPRRLALAAAVALPFVLGGCQLPTFWGYRGSTAQAHDEFRLWSGTFIAAIVVGVITGFLIIWSIVRYRRRSDDVPRQFQYHFGLEVAYTVIPVIIVLILFGFTVVTENAVDDVAPHPAVSVDVNAFQWGWQFTYAGKGVSIEGETLNDPDPVGLNGAACAPADHCLGPGLVVPAGKTVRIYLRSKDTIHGFYVPQFNFSRYAQPGVLNKFDLTVQHSGIYRAQCTQFCGLYHSEMFFHVVALPPSQFQAWLSTEQSATTAAARSSSVSGQAATGATAATGHISTSTRKAAA
ncbi:MAG TPA: cytochrome c oxidase subunit II [Acidimicrobiales bacterium]